MSAPTSTEIYIRDREETAAKWDLRPRFRLAALEQPDD